MRRTGGPRTGQERLTGDTETETGDPGAQAPEPPGPAGQGRPVPVNAMFENDFVTQLVVVLDTDTVEEAARKVAAQVVGRRVPRGTPGWWSASTAGLSPATSPWPSPAFPRWTS